MKISFLSILLLIVLAIPVSSQAPRMAWMTSVEPDSGKAGDILTVHGSRLDKENVAALYMTNGEVDIKVMILEQSADQIRFRIPPEANPGRFSLMVLVGKGDDQKLLEQPIRVTVEPSPKGPTVT